MSPEQFVAQPLGLAGAGALFYAASAKVLRHEQLGATLQAVGVPAPSVASKVVLAAELGTAISIVLVSVRFVPAIACLVLGGSFAATGIWVIRRRLHVECHCFGLASAPKQLGLRQLVALPAWVLMAAGVNTAHVPPDFRTRMIVLNYVILSVATVYAARSLSFVRRSRLTRPA